MAAYTFPSAVVLIESTGALAIGASGVLRPSAGGNPVQVYDLNGSPIPSVTVGSRGVHQPFQADIPDGVLDFGSVLLPCVSHESMTAALDAQEAAVSAAQAATAAQAAAEAAASGAGGGSAFDRDRANHTGTQVSGTISDLTEVVQDLVAAMVTGGTNPVFTYDDVAGVLISALQNIAFTGQFSDLQNVPQLAWIVKKTGSTDPARPNWAGPVIWDVPDDNRPATNGSSIGGSYAAVDNLDYLWTHQ